MRKVTAAITAAVLGLVAAGAVWADEEKVALDKLPKPVVEAVKKRFPKGEMTAASKETENGKTVYEVSVKDDGTKMDVTISAEGKISLIEKEITAKDLPKAAAEALAKKYPNATYKIIEEIIKVDDGKETTEHYEALVVSGGKTVEVEVAADGTIKKTEDKKEEKKD